MNDWLDDLAGLREQNEPAVVVTVAATRGSVPRGSGTKMVVTAADVYGTIGGGHLEHQAIAIARDQLSMRSNGRALRRFPLGASLGQCCGGVVNLLFEPFTVDSPWLGEALALRRDRVPFIIVSAMNDANVTRRAIVTADRIYDAADVLDDDAVAVVRERLARAEPAQLWRADDRGDGTMFFLDPIGSIDFEIVLFGAGHVGRALCPNELSDRHPGHSGQGACDHRNRRCGRAVAGARQSSREFGAGADLCARRITLTARDDSSA